MQGAGTSNFSKRPNNYDSFCGDLSLIMSRFVAGSFQAVLAGGVCIVLSVCGSTVNASGFALPESSAAGLGTANAIVANPEETGAFAYNPAAMGFHAQSSIAFGSIFYRPRLSVGTSGGKGESKGASWFPTPILQGAFKIDDRWRFGFGVNVPFGLETRWKLGTFPALSAPIPTEIPGLVLPAGLDHPTQSKLVVLGIVPTATYSISDNLSLSAGVDYYTVPDAVMNTQVAGLDGHGDGWGWNVSALYSSGPWSLGGAFRSAATIGIEGRATSTFPRQSSVGAELDLNLPWRLQLGVRYEVNEKLAVEFDWNRTGWSEFDELSVKSKATGEILTSNKTDWKDANAYRMSATYDLLPATQVRIGYAFDETGQPEDHYTPRIPDNDRHLFSLGVGHDFSRGWALEAAYTYAKLNERTVRGARQYVPTGDINGTTAVDGDYESNAHVFAVELVKAF